MMKGKVVAALIGLSLGMSGGVLLSNRVNLPTVLADKTENDSDSEPNGNTIVRGENYFDKSMSVEDLKDVLLKNYANIAKRSFLVVKNQTSLSGHLSDVLEPLFNEFYSKKEQLDVLYLINDGLDTKDFNELMQLLQKYKIEAGVFLDHNQIADFSSANTINISAWEQKTDPAVNRQLPTLSVNNQQQVLIPLKDIWKFGASKIGFSITSVSNPKFPLSEGLGELGYDDFRVHDFTTGLYSEEALDYRLPTLAYLPNQYQVESDIDDYVQHHNNEDYIDKIKKYGFTVDSYFKYLNDVKQRNVVINHVAPDAKKLELRLVAAPGSGTGFDPTLEFSLKPAESSSSSANPPSAGSSESSKVPASSDHPYVPSADSTSDNPSGASSREVTEAPQINKNPSIAKKGQAVYALNKIHLYQKATFGKTQRVASYVKKPRINRPMFVVTDYLYSNAGRLRYRVRDVNHHSPTAGKKGYITANWQYVRPVYYTAKHSTLTVINPTGVNEYRSRNLAGKVRNFKQGTRIKVTGFVKHRLTTRYRLANGHYITGNRKLVIAGNYPSVKKIKTNRTIYLHHNPNLNQRIKKINRGTTLRVKKWLYSHPYSTTIFGAQRYQVVGGYVTANQDFIKIIK